MLLQGLPSGGPLEKGDVQLAGTTRPVVEAVMDGARIAHVRAGGTSLVLRLAEDELPCVLHWGPDLGDLTSDDLASMAVGLRPQGEGIEPHAWLSVLPRKTAGWLGRPGLQGSRAGESWALTYASVTHAAEPLSGGWLVSSAATDASAGVEVRSELQLLDGGMVRLRAILRNMSERPFVVDSLEPCLPVPSHAVELLDMAGRPGHERVPQRKSFDQGLWWREARGGRPGHDSATLLCAGEPGFGFRSGTLWAVHVAWSGNQVLGAECSHAGWRLLRGGELLESHEVVLEYGDSYASPWLYGSWGVGIDQMAHRFHQMLRGRPERGRRPRPVTLNTWEAIYHNVNTSTLIELARCAAELGVERFVLDDGWFRNRTDDTRALGDWEVDEHRFPDGLAPLVNTVRGLGMEFGLWVEPEMISLDSELARAHPEWILGTDLGPGLSSRNQHVLDLANPEAWAHVLERLWTLIDRHDISSLKWDHNRPLLGAGRGPRHVPAVRAQTLAVYRLMAELTSRRSGLEIEACCGGGGRLDLGVMEYADRAWVSDCIDPHERHRSVRWTGLVLPLEMLGTHVGSSPDHTSGRRHSMAFRAATALWGHMGLELDVRALDEHDRSELVRWIEAYKSFRPLLHSGVIVHSDFADPSLQVDGVIAPDAREGLFRVSLLDHPSVQPAGRLTLPGLDPNVDYCVTVHVPGTSPRRQKWPEWYETGARHRGSSLSTVGVLAPNLDVDELVYFHVQELT